MPFCKKKLNAIRPLFGLVSSSSIHKLWPRMMMPLLAEAAARPIDKLHNVSGQFWIKVILAFAILALFILLVKKVMGMNKIILIIICAVVVGLLGFNWIYERNEPAFMTPIIEPLANSGFFPAKDAYNGKQQQDPAGPGIHKNTPPTKPAGTPGQPAKK